MKRRRRVPGHVKAILRAGVLQKRRRTLWKMQGGCCAYCGAETAVDDGTVDHRIPLSRDGTDDMENLLFSCDPCNNKKGAATEQEYRATLVEVAA